MRGMIYILQVSACTGIFYTFYIVFLRRLTFFSLNRWYLLLTLTLSLVIPALSFDVDIVTQSPTVQQVFYMQQINIPTPFKAPTAVSHEKAEINWPLLIQFGYIAVGLGYLVNTVRSLIKFKQFTIANEELYEIEKIKIFRAKGALSNSSFLNAIFIEDENLSKSEIDLIIRHEITHIKLWHTADRLVARVILCVLWLNPFCYLYTRAIEENHEFEVDSITARDSNKQMYANLLLKLATAGNDYLSHSFSGVPLKTRVIMLFNKPTSNMKKIIYLLTLPVIVVSCLAFSRIEAVNKVAAEIKFSAKKMIQADTVRYQQKIKRTIKQKAAEDKAKAEYAAYRKSADYAQKESALNRVSKQILTYIVVSPIDTSFHKHRFKGIKLIQGKDLFVINTNQGELKILNDLLKAGDEIQIKVFAGMWSKELPVIFIPAVVMKNGKELFSSMEAKAIPANAFLYEANKVRFTDGEVTNIVKYQNGKWKRAVVEVNGFKIKLNIKESAPEITGIAPGDQVRLRFIHEVKTGVKEYTVNDWVAISNDIKAYGIKNPDFFDRFYEKI